MIRFSDIPTERFPLNFHKYCQLREGVDDLGTASGRGVSRELMDIHGCLGRAWELIREIERRENAR